jgi:hypothetical protein
MGKELLVQRDSDPPIFSSQKASSLQTALAEGRAATQTLVYVSLQLRGTSRRWGKNEALRDRPCRDELLP